MPIDFPTSPTTGQVYTYQGKSWVYNGTGWDSPRALSEIGAVQTFENAAARTAAIPTPTEGIVTYLNDVDILSIYDGTGWGNSLSPKGGILQVVSTNKTDTFTTTSTTFTAITGLSASITPSSTSSKILAIVSVEGATQNAVSASSGGFRLMRNSTPVGVGDSAGDRKQVTGLITTRLTQSGVLTSSATKSILDTPATTSSITYSVEIFVGAGTIFINRNENDSNSSDISRPVSTLTLMEVAG